MGGTGDGEPRQCSIPCASRLGDELCRTPIDGRAESVVLNLARAHVKEFVFNFLDKLVSENDIAFLKWDYNRNWSEPGWAAAPQDRQKEIYVRYVENLYEILARLR